MAFIQEQVVNHLHWLTPQQFLDGLALGQLTPGTDPDPGRVRGLCCRHLWGAVAAVAAVYLPSFTLMLAVLPMLERMKRLSWMPAALQGISPAVIGMTAVAVLRMLPPAILDLITGVVAVGTVVAMGLWHLSPLPLIIGGAAVGLSSALDCCDSPGEKIRTLQSSACMGGPSAGQTCEARQKPCARSRMTTMQDTDFVSNWKEIALGFLKLGVTAYGGPAIMGLMQAELQEKRQWLPKERFVEGLSLVNMVPGATPRRSKAAASRRHRRYSTD